MIVNDIRNLFIDKHNKNETRGGTIELQAVSFLADEESIFGSVNREYVDAEIEWYESKDRRVQTLFDIYGKDVAIWKNVADEHGEVNSNYGWCIQSSTRYFQYNNVYHALKDNPNTRQAVMIYTHPAMHYIAGRDFTCTNAVQYFINDDQLDCVVQMRSNDAVFGYNNDYQWQRYVLNKLATELNLSTGHITWQVGSLHIYERHYHLIK